MKIIIVGAGKVGATLVESFINENHDLVIVDNDVKTVESVVNKFDVKGIVGGGCERDILLEAGVDKADFFISTTSRDEMNILCCVLAKKLGARYTVARVRDPEYFKEVDNMKESLALDLAFNPEYRTAVEIAQILKFPSALSFEKFAGGKVNLLEFRIDKDNPIIGKTIMDIRKEYRFNVLFAMVKRGEEVFIPHGDFIIKKEDHIHIMGVESEIAGFCKKLRIFKPSAKSVFIIGGGKICYYLAKKLTDANVNVKILENDEKRCVELSKELRIADILCGDGTDQEVLSEEKLEHSDACVTLTGMDEENVIISLFAKQQGVGKVITKIDRPSVKEMVKKFGLDTVVSPRNIIANHILRFVRAHQADSGKGVNSLYKFYGKIEALEFTVDDEFPCRNVSIKDLKIKKSILICGIVREGQFILPTGDSCFLTGDKVLVVTPYERLTGLKQILR